MSVVVLTEGLPPAADINSVIIALRKSLEKHKIRFWVRDLSYVEKTNSKKCKIHFFSKEAAFRAIDNLSSRPHVVKGVLSNLKLRVVAENPEERSKPRARSRSPISREAATINDELKQLDKEKEELEKRKTELLNKKLKAEQQVSKEEGIDQTSIEPIQYINNNSLILTKYADLELIMIEMMKPLLKAHAKKRYYQNFMQCVHVELRVRLAILFESSNVHSKSPVPQILETYRKKYPTETDKDMVENILSQLRMSFWAYKTKNENASEPYEYEESDEEEIMDKQGEINNEASNAVTTRGGMSNVFYIDCNGDRDQMPTVTIT